MKKSNLAQQREGSRMDKQDLIEAAQSSSKALQLWARCLFSHDEAKQNEFIEAAAKDKHKFLSMAMYPRNAQLCAEMARLDKAVDGQALRNKNEV